jgi:hypothetical protein
MPSRASSEVWKTSLTALGMILFVGGCGGCGGGSLDLDSADQSSPRRKADRAAPGIAAPPGFQAIVAVEGLNYPSAMDWDDQGRLFILQSHSVDLPLTGVKVVRFEKGG